ncbi:MAG TPA: hypothetical protein VFD58_27535 [Blastocatellia bacterium]|nr:hypothetical protein [Blastocatellia bacterium]
MIASTPTALHRNFRRAYESGEIEQAREHGRIFLDALAVIEW